MAIMLSKLYAALRAANAPESAAREAAEEIAGYENRFARLEGDMAVLKWMVGTNIVITVAVFLKLFLR
jgi:phage shock protein A